MTSFILNFLGNILANLLPGFVTRAWEKIVLQRWLGRPPRELLREIDLFLETMFPEASPRVRYRNCRYLPNSSAFFLEKQDMIDSLAHDENGEVTIICRVPYLVMPDNYRDVYLNSTEARGYYAMLEAQAKEGKLRYLYNLNALSGGGARDAIMRGADLNCYPILISTTSFDIMMSQTDRHRHQVIFAMRPMGVRDEEVGILVEQRDLYLFIRKFFDRRWKEASSYWMAQIARELPALEEVFRFLQS